MSSIETSPVPKEKLAGNASQLADIAATKSKPVSPHVHLIKGKKATLLFVSNGSRLYTIAPEIEQKIETLLQNKNEEALQQELVSLGIDSPEYIDDKPLESPPLYALSLAIAQKCNMGCTYCYADQGDFGGQAKNMPIETALKSIDMLVDKCEEGKSIQLTFLGGEPLVNRSAIRQATEYAHAQAKQKNIRVNFSITTNGTLLTEDDAHFFEQYGFALTLSLDGLKEEHNQQRPMKSGKGSFDRIMKNIKPVLAIQKRMQVSARVTVTPQNTNLPVVLDEFIQMGFHSVGFSPLLKSSNGKNEMSKDDLQQMLENMIACGLKFEQQVLAGNRYPFLNMVNALKEISKGTHRPYPCGAGAGYMGVSADGELSACHRFVNDPRGKMGDIDNGISAELQNSWLANRHVHTQQPCTQCWARYLCGGACHHEVLDKGRIACDYIRGWLYYTIQAHDRLSRMAPNSFI